MKQTILTLADHAPAFRDAEATAAELAELGIAGDAAVGFLVNGTSPSQEWGQQQVFLLERAAKPKGLLRITVLDAMRQLIDATVKAR